MKIFFSLICFSLSLYSESVFELKVSGDQEKVQLEFITKDMCPDLSRLVVTQINLVEPSEDAMGLIELSIQADKASMAAQVIGKRKGSFFLNRGQRLPLLKDGTYLLSVNGYCCGSLFLSEEGVVFENLTLKEVS